MPTITIIAPIQRDSSSGVKLTPLKANHARIAIHNQLIISAEEMRKFTQMNNRFILTTSIIEIFELNQMKVRIRTL